MASIFTFDPDPPRISSPWGTPRASTPAPLTKLEAEPQEGPIEYKLHLLLRRRRKYRSSSTAHYVSGSYRSTSASPKPRVLALLDDESLSLQATSSHSRQQRLEQLTTQLLWRLQQSCHHHSFSAGKRISPTFPQVGALAHEVQIGPLIPGLEESRGALYEIGVADDGTFVGLVDDEMNESLQNLRAMAASLGCFVHILRKVAVGTCEFVDSDGTKNHVRREQLWVVEAYVKPDLAKQPSTVDPNQQWGTLPFLESNQIPPGVDPEPVPQLRVSLTGATMSGKSTLLGSLTTGTLDNGRGKSRLNLLKHRHEIASGMTSSVTQELLGYTQELTGTVQVVNYASDDVSSWTDIHSACGDGRLVLLSDSAGHPRYRRTILRGIIGWAPHWTLLCIPADNAEDTSGLLGSTPPAEEVLGLPVADIDLSQTHLELCLKLQLRLVVIITKLDLASKTGLRQTLAKVLSALKVAHRTPMIVPSSTSSGDDLMTIPTNVYATCGETAASLVDQDVVPIVLTSAVKGSNITSLHALLCQLPAPERGSIFSLDEPEVLFHVEDTYATKIRNENQRELPVLSGHLARGTLSIGDLLWLGPFTSDIVSDQTQHSTSHRAERPSIPTSRSFPGALSDAKSLPSRAAYGSAEWVQVKITSLRYLRLSVAMLFADQVGTIGTSLVNSLTLPPAATRIRKGMVVAKSQPLARRGFVADFARTDVDGLSIGMNVVVYVASVRASAKVVAGAVPDDESMESSIDSLDKLALEAEVERDGAFTFELDKDVHAPKVKRTRENMSTKKSRLMVTFQFIATKEFLDIGSKVLVMPGGGAGLYVGNERGEKGIAGFDCFVGTIRSAY